MLLDTLIALPVLLDLGLLYQIWKERDFFKNFGSFHAFASVIVPVKGIDNGLEDNVKSLLSQEYPDPYEVIYVVEEDDPVQEVLKKFNVKVVKAEDLCDKCSGKIRAQLTGLKYAKGNVIVFADSDTRFHRNWLRELVAPLGAYMASTTFSIAKPARLTLNNVLRAGFWTLGFESQALGGTFLWGGSMAFKREFFDEEVIKELSREWCDDCTLTRIVKRRGGKIALVGRAEPLNVYDEKDLWKWAERQVITVRVYSRRGAKAFLLIGAYFVLLLALLFVTLSLVYVSPYFLWIVKNLLRTRRREALLPSIASVPGVVFAWLVLIASWRKKEVVWRGRVYQITPSSP
ncbi:MAG: glycosyl transferase family protein [Candidatus Aramenus sulfurataquae]|jgi:cellulose synthase/poly-beta-1,6-N-acetylglucosamine synthase-like glycosyltransferase|uniref:Glycosyl transferase family 2 n=2 Tax=Candidatus Aramenus sulfurataquae TaxID=1326980 RepID=W7L7K1_9CREN|nr:MAG: glycosyl transferase family protein [Candidatus Aramenus sulfurataquae]MCL7343837.1 glycosyltransferase family 2 protein [Candidatus Aramenus sulfurataquae]